MGSYTVLFCVRQEGIWTKIQAVIFMYLQVESFREPDNLPLLSCAHTKVVTVKLVVLLWKFRTQL